MKKFYGILIGSLVSLCISNVALSETKSLTTQQYRVDSMQGQYNAERRKYDATSELIAKQEKRIAQIQASLKKEQATLAQRKKEQATQHAALLKVKAKLDEEERILNIIWDKTHRPAAKPKKSTGVK